ncbi:MAG: chemotaxis protein CheB [Coleofasciculus sp. S288]|nr:chemotaxis protein CheB [Coleofasciculus sp. S288]
MSNRDIIVIGASAGGVEALSQLVKLLPSDLPAALFVVVHFPSFGISVLPQILSRAGSLPAVHPQDGEAIVPGKIYIAPPGYHLLVQPNHVRLSREPRENGLRPAIDTLFRSAARAYGRRVMGVILTGTLDDGTAGLAAIKARGGVSVVQDPEEALFEGMPRSAIENVAVDHILKLADIALILNEMSHEPVEVRETVSGEIDREAEIVFQDKAALERGERPGNPSPLTCPDCGGVLWELQDDDLIRFRCHVGHVYSSNSLLAEQSDSVEVALWSAVRTLEEKAALARRMAVQARQQNRLMSEAQFRKRAEEAEQHSALVRQVILQQNENKLRNAIENMEEERSPNSD